ncbi:hypothetical protein SAMN05192543_10667 [Paraburkholderia megapolitana]|uniref:Uncharacterized protein n=2 Tax=Paraburkholderia megapolitana TaxID=420953 RepID=A0A1I3PT39_9BURK|nr:hypothetical protein SAMN05192543_10667 [Paraburkholderia megapolitana]
MVDYKDPVISFRVKGTLLAQAELKQLQRVLCMTCFDPETAPAEPTEFTLLDFGDRFWLVTDGSADRWIFRDWARDLGERGAVFEGHAGALPFSWRRRFLLFARHLYFPKACVVPAQPTPFLALSGPYDPRDKGERNRREDEERFGRGS